MTVDRHKGSWTRSGSIWAVGVAAWLALLVVGCVQPQAAQPDLARATDVRATVIAEITATALAAGTATPIPTLTPAATPTPSPTPMPTATPTSSPTPAPTATPTLSSLVEDMSPSVVQIVTPKGVGTGFVVDDYDRVITNAHVVGRQKTVEIRSSDGQTYEGKVLGVDEDADLALISLGYAASLEPLALGYSDQARVGDEVIAMGFPLSDKFDDSLTITKGIVSAKRTSEAGLTLLQTDAAINPGNSGGPLIGRDGQVVGVSSSKVFKSDDGRPLEGISLAIGINEARARLQSLARGESVLSGKRGEFGALELASALEAILPSSFGRLDTDDEGFGFNFMEDDDVFRVSVTYGSIDPFQMIALATSELNDSERSGLDLALSNLEAFEDEFLNVFREGAAANPDSGINAVEILDPIHVGDYAMAVRMGAEVERIEVAMELAIFLRGNYLVMAISVYFPEEEPSVSLKEIADAIDAAIVDGLD